MAVSKALTTQLAFNSWIKFTGPVTDRPTDTACMAEMFEIASYIPNLFFVGQRHPHTVWLRSAKLFSRLTPWV